MSEQFDLGGASGLRRAPLGVEGWLAVGWGSLALLHVCLHPPNASLCVITAEAEVSESKRERQRPPRAESGTGAPLLLLGFLGKVGHRSGPDSRMGWGCRGEGIDPPLQ